MFAASRAGWKGHDSHVIREQPTLTTPDAQVRRRRTRDQDRASGSGPVVAVTGAARGLGHALTVRLATSARVRRVIAIDDHRGEATGVTWRVVDVRHPALARRLGEVDVLVHTDLDGAGADPARAGQAQRARHARPCSRRGRRGGHRVILLSSAMVYGALPDNPVPIPDSAPLRGRCRTARWSPTCWRSSASAAAPRARTGPARHGAAPGHRHRPRRGHGLHQALRGPAAARGQGHRALLAVLPPRGPGRGARVRRAA